MSGTDPAFRSFYGNRSVQVDVLHRVCPNLLYGTNPENGSVLLGIRIIGSIETGDIIVFRHNEKLFVKRVAAVGGDIIEENGQSLTVPAECFYVLGDNTEHSYDSRCWKEPFVERQDVLAVVIIP